MTSKVCSKCKQEKPLEEFYKRQIARDGKASCCKTCKSLAFKTWLEKNRENNKGRSKAYYTKNRRKILEKLANKRKTNKQWVAKKKEYVQANRERINTHRRKRWAEDEKHREKEKKRSREWKKKNLDKVRKYIKDRYWSNPKKYKEISQKSNEQLSNNYIKNLITRHDNIDRNDIPDSLIDLTKVYILAKRTVRKYNKDRG